MYIVQPLVVCNVHCTAPSWYNVHCHRVHFVTHLSVCISPLRAMDFGSRKHPFTPSPSLLSSPYPFSFSALPLSFSLSPSPSHPHTLTPSLLFHTFGNLVWPIFPPSVSPLTVASIVIHRVAAFAHSVPHWLQYMQYYMITLRIICALIVDLCQFTCTYLIVIV